MSLEEIDKYLLSFPNTWRDYPFGDNIAVYKVGPKPDPEVASKMFAILNEDKNPLKLSLKCDPTLAKILRDKYEEVMPGANLNDHEWNTLVLSGQLSAEDLKGLMHHSFNLANAGD